MAHPPTHVTHARALVPCTVWRSPPCRRAGLTGRRRPTRWRWGRRTRGEGGSVGLGGQRTEGKQRMDIGYKIELTAAEPTSRTPPATKDSCCCCSYCCCSCCCCCFCCCSCCCCFGCCFSIAAAFVPVVLFLLFLLLLLLLLITSRRLFTKQFSLSESCVHKKK